MTAISFTPLQEVDIVFLGYYPETKSLQIMYLFSDRSIKIYYFIFDFFNIVILLDNEEV